MVVYMVYLQIIFDSSIKWLLNNVNETTINYS